MRQLLSTPGHAKCSYLLLVVCLLAFVASPCYSVDPSQAEQAFLKAQKGDYDGAAVLLKSCGDKSAWSAPTKVRAAKIYEQAGQLALANQLLDQVTAAASNKNADLGSVTLAWRYKGDCARDAGKLEEAESFFEQSGKCAPTLEMKLLAYRAAARIRRQQHRLQEALDILVKAAPHGTDNVWWHYERASTLVEMNKFAAAIDDLTFIIDVVKKRQQKIGDTNVHLLTQAYNLRIKCYEQMHMAKAESDDRKALKEINQSWEEDLLGPEYKK